MVSSLNKKVCVITATRAEYGLLRNLIEEINRDEELKLQLLVTGTHLSHKYGYTLSEIINDGFEITQKIPILGEQNDEQGIIEAMATATIQFGNFFIHDRPDMIVVLGDRYEILPICNVATILGIPITHISGGEITEGAVDDVIRHSITKMAYLHFPGCETYRKRIIQMGENPERVFNFGDIGVENVLKMKYLSRVELMTDLNISAVEAYICVTFHPVTQERGKAKEQIVELLEAMKCFPKISFIITKANADYEGEIINNCIEEYAQDRPNWYIFASVGIKRYLSLLKYSEMVIGNSSSGIVEAPIIGIPTVNIGNRQKGRLKASSVIDSKPDRISIECAIKKALTKECKMVARNTLSPYGNGDTSFKIKETIKEYFQKDGKTQKIFYDLSE